MHTEPQPNVVVVKIVGRHVTIDRLPITAALLETLLNVLPVVCSSLYKVILFSAGFFIFILWSFRVSELVLDSTKGSSSHAMDACSIQVFFFRKKLLKFMWLIQIQISLVGELY